MADNNDFLPEEASEQNRQLMHHLRQVYRSSNEDAQSLARIRERLFNTSDISVQDDSGSPPQSGTLRSKRERFSSMNRSSTHSHFHQAGVWQQRFGAIAAALFVTLLVGSLVLLFNHARQGRVGAPGHTGNTQPPAQQTIAFSSIHMLDAQKGWAVAGSSILRTTDGGIHWNNVTPPKNSLKSTSATHFLTASTAWVSIPLSDTNGLGGVATPSAANSAATLILRTVDAGQTWQRATIQASGVSQIVFTNLQNGWILSKPKATANAAQLAAATDVFRSSDGGMNWVKVASTISTGNVAGALPTDGIASGLSFLNASTGWLSGIASKDNTPWLYVTHDGGQTWQQQTLLLPLNTNSAHVTTLPPLFFNTRDGILPASLQIGNALSTIFFVTHDGGISWQSTTPLPLSIATSDNADATGTGYSFIDVNHGWFLDGATLYTTVDGGQQWTKITTNVSLKHVSSLEFVSNKIGWAISGQTPFLLKTVDGGRTWAAWNM